MRATKLGMAAVLSTCMTVLAACGSDGGSGATSDDTIRVALMMPTSGPAAAIGETYVAMVEHIVEEVNDAGGLTVGGEKYDVEVTVFDDGNTAEVAQRSLRDALSDDYEFLIGPFGSAPTAGVVSEIAKSDVFWLVNAVLEGPTKNESAFRTTMIMPSVDEAFLKLLESKPEIERVAITTDRQHAGATDRTDELVADIEALGREVVSQEEHQLGDTDLRAIITKMKSKNPDVYLMRGYPSETPVFIQQVRELAGADALVVTQPPLTNDDTRKIFADTSVLENAYIAGAISALDPLVAEENQRAVELAKALGDDAGTFSVWAHDSFTIFLAGLENAEEPSAEAMIASMEDLTVGDLDGKTLNEFEPQDGDRLFGSDREVRMVGTSQQWDNDAGWVRIN